MKIHRGPINLSSMTMKDPHHIFQELLVVLKSRSVKLKKESTFVVNCESKKSRFSIEMQTVEKLSGVFVIKFFRKGNENEHYLDVCDKIFNKMNL